jgi:uncharacterized protein YdaU (DUF1376 family)
MASSYPWFPFYVDDFFLDEKVQCMNHAQVGMYLRLLSLQWQEGSIPSDPTKLSAILGIDANAFRTQCDWVSECFKQCVNNTSRMQNSRMEHERILRKHKSEKARESSQTRWVRRNKSRMRTHSKRTPNGKQSDSEGNAIHSHSNTPLPPKRGNGLRPREQRKLNDQRELAMTLLRSMGEKPTDVNIEVYREAERLACGFDGWSERIREMAITDIISKRLGE